MNFFFLFFALQSCTKLFCHTICYTMLAKKFNFILTWKIKPGNGLWICKVGLATKIIPCVKLFSYYDPLQLCSIFLYNFSSSVTTNCFIFSAYAAVNTKVLPCVSRIFLAYTLDCLYTASLPDMLKISKLLKNYKLFLFIMWDTADHYVIWHLLLKKHERFHIFLTFILLKFYHFHVRIVHTVRL